MTSHVQNPFLEDGAPHDSVVCTHRCRVDQRLLSSLNRTTARTIYSHLPSEPKSSLAVFPDDQREQEQKNCADMLPNDEFPLPPAQSLMTKFDEWKNSLSLMPVLD